MGHDLSRSTGGRAAPPGPTAACRAEVSTERRAGKIRSRKSEACNDVARDSASVVHKIRTSSDGSPTASDSTGTKSISISEWSARKALNRRTNHHAASEEPAPAQRLRPGRRRKPGSRPAIPSRSVASSPCSFAPSSLSSSPGLSRFKSCTPKKSSRRRPMTDCTLCHTQFVGRARKRAVASDRVERNQRAEGWQAAGHRGWFSRGMI